MVFDRELRNTFAISFKILFLYTGLSGQKRFYQYGLVVRFWECLYEVSISKKISMSLL